MNWPSKHEDYSFAPGCVIFCFISNCRRNLCNNDDICLIAGAPVVQMFVL